MLRACAGPFVIAATVAVALPAMSQDMPERPERVVSVNLCTDQLAMMLAAEGQLISVSDVALDPQVSAMTEEAQKYRINYALAEDIYLMQPDLVIAGSYSAQATLDMLERLGIPVARFAPAYSLAEVRDRMAQMGDLLGQQEAADAMIADFDARLAALRAEVDERPTAALYYANGYTSGDKTLSGEILAAAGFENIAGTLGFPSFGRIPLEVLALAQPDALVTSRPYPGASRSEAILDHPVVEALREGRADASFSDKDWVCGTPYVLRAIESLRPLRNALTKEP
ncbi:iron complex transport system substrate-binding protein [Sagittula marina]|uniref:Iron complex transport system substrate-binding protein n=1 Tax=Sagittula marina TaxID=943940 RepID=A0A7W6DPV3_9RHOB|nr:ABC transporter substrate-binding protein [Sagittula marina]MBB3985496.1 iron complex transport system substrate-binding protein [Sagittula marina]